MIARRVVRHAFGRHRAQLLFQHLQVVRACDFGAVRQPEHEIAEAEMIDHELPQVVQQRRRVFQQERCADRSGERFAVRPARLKHHGNVRLARAHEAGELDAGLARQRAGLRKLDVRNHAEHVLFVPVEVLPCLFERAAQQDLGPRLQSHQLVREVDPFGHEAQRVIHQFGVDDRQERRVEPDVVLDDDDRLHAQRPRIADDVDPILDQLDDRRQDPHVALPEKDAGQIGGVVPRHEIAGGARVVREQRHRDVAAAFADAARERRGVHVADVQRADDQVVAAVGRGARERFGARRHARQRRWMADVEIEELTEDQLVELAVLRERERIVQAGDEQDLLDAEVRQVDEALPGSPILQFCNPAILQSCNF